MDIYPEITFELNYDKLSGEDEENDRNQDTRLCGTVVYKQYYTWGHAVLRTISMKALPLMRYCLIIKFQVKVTFKKINVHFLISKIFLQMFDNLIWWIIAKSLCISSDLSVPELYYSLSISAHKMTYRSACNIQDLHYLNIYIFCYFILLLLYIVQRQILCL